MVDVYNHRKPKSFSRLRAWNCSTTPLAHAGRPPRRRAGAGRRARQLGRRRVGRARRRSDLPRLPRTPAAARRSRRRHGRRPRPPTGSHFEPVCEVYRDEFGAESFERPVVLRRPDGGWRLYLSCATPDSKHWWIEALDADRPEDLPDRPPHRRAPRRRHRRGQGPGDHRARRPLGDVALRAPADRARPRGPDDHVVPHQRATAWPGPVTAPSSSRTPGTWDARGARVTTVLSHDPLVVLYDGRADRRGQLARDHLGRPRRRDRRAARRPRRARCCAPPTPTEPCATPRAVPQPDGSTRFYFELARPDGAHDLVTTLSRRLTRPSRAAAALERAALAVGLPLLERLPGQLLEQGDVLAGAGPAAARAAPG